MERCLRAPYRDIRLSRIILSISLWSGFLVSKERFPNRFKAKYLTKNCRIASFPIKKTPPPWNKVWREGIPELENYKSHTVAAEIFIRKWLQPSWCHRWLWFIKGIWTCAHSSSTKFNVDIRKLTGSEIETWLYSALNSNEPSSLHMQRTRGRLTEIFLGPDKFRILKSCSETHKCRWREWYMSFLLITIIMVLVGYKNGVDVKTRRTAVE